MGAITEYLQDSFAEVCPRGWTCRREVPVLDSSLAELFGYAPGAFTGAHKDGNPGRLREADGGTLFLDEIGDMPLALQCRLLRALQDREVTPLGGGKPVAVDFALICATHRCLRDEVEAGRFRADLYYRLNGRNRSLSGVLCPPAPTRNNPSHIHQGGAGSDQGDSDQQQVAAA